MITREIAEIVSRALREDLGGGDLTSLHFIPASARATARLVAKQTGVLCGIEVAREVFRQAGRGLRFRVRIADGRGVRPGTCCAEIGGSARAILSAERTALNFVQRLSGIATLTSEFVRAVRGTGASICDTRKTTPGLRVLEKYAVRCGGGRNHRFGLFDAVMLKENHLALSTGDLKAVLRRVRKKAAFVSIEAQSWKDVERGERLPVDIVLLDNLPPPVMRRAVKRLRRSRPDLLIEASGGVTLANVRAVARTGVDRISVGRLTHSAPALDFSLDVEPS